MNWQRQPFEPEPEIKLRVWYTHPNSLSRVYTTMCDSPRDADRLARIYADLVTTERVVIYMPDGTTRVYMGPEQRAASGIINLPLATIGGR